MKKIGIQRQVSIGDHTVGLGKAGESAKLQHGKQHDRMFPGSSDPAGDFQKKTAKNLQTFKSCRMPDEMSNGLPGKKNLWQ